VAAIVLVHAKTAPVDAGEGSPRTAVQAVVTNQNATSVMMENSPHQLGTNTQPTAKTVHLARGRSNQALPLALNVIEAMEKIKVRAKLAKLDAIKINVDRHNVKIVQMVKQQPMMLMVGLVKSY